MNEVIFVTVSITMEFLRVFFSGIGVTVSWMESDFPGDLNGLKENYDYNGCESYST